MKEKLIVLSIFLLSMSLSGLVFSQWFFQSEEEIIIEQCQAECQLHKEKGEALLNQAKDGRLYFLPSVRQAEEEFNRALEFGDDSRIHVNLGIIAGIYGDYPKAYDEFNTALKMDPKNTYALNNLAFAYYDQGRFYKAYALWRKSLKINPDQPEVRKLVN